MNYNKPHKNIPEQINLLEQRGLIVNDKVLAESILSRISYYRLSAYFLPFQHKKDSFRNNVSFDDILKLYEFDRRLRIFVFDYLEIIEVMFKTSVCIYMTDKYGAFFYTDKLCFSQYFKHEEWLFSITEEKTRSKETFIRHFEEKYFGDQYLPFWMIVEIMSFGSLSLLVNGLKSRDKKEIGDIFSIPAPVLSSWLHFLTYIRNLCAHHSRLWNREFAIRPKFPDNDCFWDKIRNDRMSSFVAVAEYLFKLKGIDRSIENEIGIIIKSFGINPVQMGFKSGI
jgi:abortive infection bacteriophage resistance protein